MLKKGKYPKGQSGRVSCQACREISIRHQQELKKQFVATRLLRHVGRIEATPHSSNQVNTGMTTHVNTGVDANPTRSNILVVCARPYRKAAFNRFVVFCNCRFKASTCLAISSSSCFAIKPAAAT